MNESNPIQCVAVNFRRLLATGKSVALEDAATNVWTPDGFDRRVFGCIVRAMQRDGEIVEAGYRRATSVRCNSGIKRLWVLANKQEGQSRG